MLRRCHLVHQLAHCRILFNLRWWGRLRHPVLPCLLPIVRRCCPMLLWTTSKPYTADVSFDWDLTNVLNGTQKISYLDAEGDLQTLNPSDIEGMCFQITVGRATDITPSDRYHQQVFSVVPDFSNCGASGSVNDANLTSDYYQKIFGMKTDQDGTGDSADIYAKTVSYQSFKRTAADLSTRCRPMARRRGITPFRLSGWRRTPYMGILSNPIARIRVMWRIKWRPSEVRSSSVPENCTLKACGRKPGSITQAADWHPTEGVQFEFLC